MFTTEKENNIFLKKKENKHGASCPEQSVQAAVEELYHSIVHSLSFADLVLSCIILGLHKKRLYCKAYKL